MMSFTEMRKSGRGIGLGMIIPSKVLTFNRALFFIFKLFIENSLEIKDRLQGKKEK